MIFTTLIVWQSLNQNLNLFNHVQMVYLIVIIQKEWNWSHVFVLVWVIFAYKNLNTAFKICSISFKSLVVVKMNNILIIYSAVLFFLWMRITLLNFIREITPDVVEQNNSVVKFYKFLILLITTLRIFFIFYAMEEESR